MIARSRAWRPGFHLIQIGIRCTDFLRNSMILLTHRTRHEYQARDFLIPPNRHAPIIHLQFDIRPPKPGAPRPSNPPKYNKNVKSP